jgi:hypothetical protein
LAPDIWIEVELENFFSDLFLPLLLGLIVVFCVAVDLGLLGTQLLHLFLQSYLALLNPFEVCSGVFMLGRLD